MSSPTKVLVLQPKRIGDLILTAPAVAALRNIFPGCEVTLVTAGASGGIAGLIGADEVLNYRYGRPNLKIWARLATSSFDTCVDFGGTDRSALMARISGAPIRATYDKFVSGRKSRKRAYTHLSPASVRDLHTVDFHLALLDELPGGNPPGSGLEGRVELPNGLFEAVAELLAERGVTRPYAIVHPGTARPEKYWFPERWAGVIRHLQKNGLVPLITGSDDHSEMGHLRRIEESLDGFDGVVNLSGQISLQELAAIISSSALAVGVDSAAMHLASVFQRPQLVLFGPTNPFHWRPRHTNATVLLASSPDQPTIEFTPRHKKAPMSDISTEAATRAIDALLRKI